MLHGPRYHMHAAVYKHIDGLAQDWNNSSALAMGLLQSSINLYICGTLNGSAMNKNPIFYLLSDPPSTRRSCIPQ